MPQQLWKIYLKTRNMSDITIDPVIASMYRKRMCYGRVPFAYYRSSENTREMLPNPEELEYLFQGMKYLDKGYPYRSVAEWVSTKAGRKISHQGISIIWKDYKRRHDFLRQAIKRSA